MNQVQKLTRRNLVFAALIAVLALVVVLRPSETTAVGEKALPKLFPDLTVGDVRGITLERVLEPDVIDPPSGPTRIEIARADELNWKVASAHDYPANADRVTAFLEALQAARRKNIITQREETFDEYAPSDGWIKVLIEGPGGDLLTSFSQGKSAKWPDSYLLMGEGDTRQVVRATSLTPDKTRITIDAWAEARLWPGLTLPSVESVEIHQKEGDLTFAFIRREEEVAPEATAEGEEPAEPETKSVWKMIMPDGDEAEAEAETFAVEGLIRSFTGMRFKGIEGGTAEDPAYGLGAPAYRVVVRGEVPEGARGPAPKYVIEVGAAVVGPEAEPAEGEEAPEPREYYVRRGKDQWVFTVAAYSIGDFKKAPADFLPKPDEPEPTDEGEGKDGEGAPPAPPDLGEGTPDGDDAGPPPLPPGPAPAPPEQPEQPEPPEQPKPPEQPDQPEQPDEPKDAPKDETKDEPKDEPKDE